jgi:hypothetical protein
MTTLLRPTTELVAVAWLAGVPGLSTQMVATQLPRDNTSWAASGFVTVRTVGGQPSIYTPLRQPVLAVDAWAVNPTSNKPPWFQANGLMELIREGCEATAGHRWVTLPGNYGPAQVTSAYFVTEPQRVYTDAGAYAHYNASLQLYWAAAT